MTPEYEVALEKARTAHKAFNIVRHAYRARLVGNGEFKVARRVYSAAITEFDLAYAKEENRK